MARLASRPAASHDTVAAEGPGGSAPLRRLDGRDIAGVESHLLALDLSERHARFGSGMSDWAVAAYARRLDPDRVILVGALDPSSGAVIGFAEASPTGTPGTVEVAVSVLAPYRNRRLGRQLVDEALVRASARGATRAELLFDSENTPLIRLVAALGAAINLVRGHAAICLPARGLGE